MEEQEKQYIKGFNNGYLLSKYQPELLNKIVKDLDTKDDYCSGLISGKEEHEVEKVRDYFGRFKQNDSDRAKTKDKDRNDKEMDLEKDV